MDDDYALTVNVATPVNAPAGIFRFMAVFCGIAMLAAPITMHMDLSPDRTDTCAEQAARYPDQDPTAIGCPGR